MNATATRADVYSRVTAKIVADLERGVRPWFKPWNAEHAAGRITRPLRANGQAYKGINVLMLWGEAELKGFVCPIWMTFRQAQELGAHVKKGEHGSLVVYADKITRTETDDRGEESSREIAFMKGYTVFNCEQIEGLPPHFYATETPPKSDIERIAGAESFAANTGATVRHGGNQAYYSITDDYVHVRDCVAELRAMPGVQIDPAHVLIAGFSGGGSLAPYVATNEEPYTAFAVLHGGAFPGGFGTRPVRGWMSTGLADVIRPVAGVAAAASAVKDRGIDLTISTFPGGHEMGEGEVSGVLRWWLGN